MNCPCFNDSCGSNYSCGSDYSPCPTNYKSISLSTRKRIGVFCIKMELLLRAVPVFALHLGDLCDQSDQVKESLIEEEGMPVLVVLEQLFVSRLVDKRADLLDPIEPIMHLFLAHHGL